MSRVDQLGRYARTVRHLRPSQLGHRVRLRAQKQAYRRLPGATAQAFGRTAPPAAGWPADFRPLDAQTETPGCSSLTDNLVGRFRLLGEEHELGDPIDWQPSGASQLWRYHLHYFDWAWTALETPEDPATRDALATLYRSWRGADPVGRWDAWSPYVVALRAWTLCALFEPVVRGTNVEADLRDDLAVHARYLRANVEFDVGGNHLLKNLKALLGLAVFLDEPRLLRFAGKHLLRQLEVQVLPDGGHFERSTSYHAQVLADLLDVRDLLAAADQLPGLVAQLEAPILSMQRWLRAMLRPDGSLPLLNDAVAVSAERLAALSVHAPDEQRLQVLSTSGYVVGRPRDGAHFVFDVGPPCPEELPAHAQADALSLTLDVDGSALIVDSGTSTYTPGERRQYERTTQAHNTVAIDGEDQTEVWGAFRAGRRHRAWLESSRDVDGIVELIGRHDGYRHLPGAPLHQRTVVASEHSLRVLDRVEGEGRHDLALYWHLAPGSYVEASDGHVRIGDIRLAYGCSAPAELEIVAGGTAPLGLVATAHNELLDAPCLVLRIAAAELPVTVETTFHFPAP